MPRGTQGEARRPVIQLAGLFAINSITGSFSLSAHYVCTGIQRGTPPRASQLIDWPQQGETGTVQIGVARNPPLEHAFGLLLRHLTHNNRGSRFERRSTPITPVTTVAIVRVLISCFALAALLLAASACNQAPDDEAPGVNSQRISDADQVRQGQRVRAEAAASRQSSLAVNYELQGALVVPRPFPSREGCERARTSIVEGQAKADNQLSAHGVLSPNRPMLFCVRI